MSRRLLIVIAGFLAIVIVGLGVLWLVIGRDSGDQDPNRPKVPSTSAAATTAPGPEARDEVAEALEQLATAPEQVLAPEALAEHNVTAREAFPEGTRLTPLPETWAPDGVGGGTMTATVTYPGEGPRTYHLILAKVEGRWQVLGTQEVTA